MSLGSISWWRWIHGWWNNMFHRSSWSSQLTWQHMDTYGNIGLQAKVKKARFRRDLDIETSLIHVGSDPGTMSRKLLCRCVKHMKSLGKSFLVKLQSFDLVPQESFGAEGWYAGSWPREFWGAVSFKKLSFWLHSSYFCSHELAAIRNPQRRSSTVIWRSMEWVTENQSQILFSNWLYDLTHFQVL